MMQLPEIDESQNTIIIAWDAKEDSVMTYLHIPEHLATSDFAMMLNSATQTFAALLKENLEKEGIGLKDIVTDIAEKYDFLVKHDQEEPSRVTLSDGNIIESTEKASDEVQETPEV